MMTDETCPELLPSLDIKELLIRLIDGVGELNRKLDSLVEVSGKIQNNFLERVSGKDFFEDSVRPAPDMMTLWSLPGALRKTVMACYKLGEATADDLSRETDRLRAVESACANQLVRLGFLNKKRDGRKVQFFVE